MLIPIIKSILFCLIGVNSIFCLDESTTIGHTPTGNDPPLTVNQDKMYTNYANQPACIDNNGEEKDWYIAYKLPRLTHKPYPYNSGFSYMIFTNSSVSTGLNKQRFCVKPLNYCVTLGEIISYRDYSAKDGEEPDDFWTGKYLNPFSYDGLYYLFMERAWLFSKQFDGEYSKTMHRRMLKYLSKTLYYKRLLFSEWQLADNLINDTSSAIMRSLAIAFESKAESNGPINSLFYNDQLPVGYEGLSNYSRNHIAAHAKGVVIMNEDSGKSIWLSHSTPQFPPTRDQHLSFHDNAKSFGQTYICISFNLRETGKQIVDHLIMMEPQIYDHQLTTKLIEQVPNLSRLITRQTEVNESHPIQSEHHLIQKIDMTNNLGKLILFSKDSHFGNDIYSGLIETNIDTNLLVQSWRRGEGGKLDSVCPLHGFNTNNIKRINVRKSPNIIDWTYEDDHSKWAISDNQNQPWVCISDINRMHSQFKRGGGAICFNCFDCRFMFNNIIKEVEECPKKLNPGQDKTSDVDLYIY